MFVDNKLLIRLYLHLIIYLTPHHTPLKLYSYNRRERFEVNIIIFILLFNFYISKNNSVSNNIIIVLTIILIGYANLWYSSRYELGLFVWRGYEQYSFLQNKEPSQLSLSQFDWERCICVRCPVATPCLMWYSHVGNSLSGDILLNL